jgi:hypothetical protein
MQITAVGGYWIDIPAIDETASDTPTRFVHRVAPTAYYLVDTDFRDAVCVELYEGKVRVLVVKDGELGLTPVYECPINEMVVGL